MNTNKLQLKLLTWNQNTLKDLAHACPHSQNMCWHFVPSTPCLLYFCFTANLEQIFQLCLFHLDLCSQGRPGPPCNHLNHMLISLPCTLCCRINGTISVKQLLLPSCLLSSPHLQTGVCASHTLVVLTTAFVLYLIVLQLQQKTW